mgnify:CR=1 FL=1
MKLIFDHTKGFGKMRDKVIFYMPFGAFFDQSEYDEALNTGWFPANKDIWFQSRSTRINLSLYESNRTTEKIAKDIRCYPDVRMTPEKKARLEEIYKKYNINRFESAFTSVSHFSPLPHGLDLITGGV